jgi:DNA-binding CsgD family transcriptional regulator
VRAEGLDELRKGLWVASLSYLTDACCAVGDAEFAVELYAQLSPLTGTNVTIGHGVLVYGSADRYLGMLAATAGERELAAEHLELALAYNRRMGTDTWVAHTAHQYGRVLLGRGRRGDAERAAGLLAESRALAERIGMPTLLARLDELGPSLAPAAAPPDGLSPREVEILRLVARGRSNREIGLELSISEHTAANHIRSILRKTGSANRTEAATYAHTRGLTRDPSTR